jgi:hypothetical protein
MRVSSEIIDNKSAISGASQSAIPPFVRKFAPVSRIFAPEMENRRIIAAAFPFAVEFLAPADVRRRSLAFAAGALLSPAQFLAPLCLV